MRWILAVILLPLSLSAATNYVSLGGNDGNPGTLASQWRTIQKGYTSSSAGDTVIISHGDYGEYVSTVVPSLTVQPNSTNTTFVSFRQLRVLHTNHWLEGVHVDKTIDTDFANQNAAHIRVETTGSGLVVTNCWISDTPLISAKFHMVASNIHFFLTITNSTGNFLNSNFVAGGLVFLGANSKTYYTNHDRAAQVEAISGDGQTMVVTNQAATNWVTEPVQGLWATIFSGAGSSGYPGILIVLGSGVQGATNCIFRNNVISNLTGSAATLIGESYIFEGNRITRLNGYYAIRPFGRYGIIRRNLWIDSPNRIWFSDSETADITHPGDSSFFDYNVGAIHSQASGTTNLLFEQNWLQNFEQQLGAIDKQNQTNQGGFTFRSNVFVGVLSQMSQNADWVTNVNNTFYRVAFESSHALAAGGPATNNFQTNLNITANAFIDCGRQHSPDAGWYSTTLTVGMTLTNNFGCGPEATGWHPKNQTGSNALTFNGGDPVFLNPLNPLGADGLPFTDDDGLKPLPNSVLARNGVGALTAVSVTASNPIAHFTIASPTNWLDYVYTNYNPGWLALAPPDRGGPVRPYTVHDPIINVPGMVKFTATNSIGGLTAASTNIDGITAFSWNFGDGYRQMSSTNAEVWHRFARTGAVTITLTVTNSFGNSSSYSNTFRILPYTNFTGRVWYVATNGNDSGTGTNQNDPFLTLDKAVSVMEASNVVVVLPGVYTNNPVLDLDRRIASNEVERVYWISYGARIQAVEIEFPFFTVDGFEITECPFQAGVHIYLTATNTHVVNNVLHNYPPTGNRRGVYFVEPPVGLRDPSLDQVNCIISNNYLDQIHYVNIDVQGSNNLITRNIILNTGTNGSLEGDVVRLFGTSHTFSYNYASNIFGGHADCFQFFGTNSIDSGWFGLNMLIEGNVFFGTTNGSGTSLCQLEMDPLGTNFTYGTRELMWTNWVIRNNQFINIPGAGSIDLAGFKFYNNLFYKCRTNGGAPLVFGGPKGSSYGTEISNNVFFACGSPAAGGWYPRTNDQPDITWNWTLNANYNYVAKEDFSAYAEAPPDAQYSFKSDGQDANGINGGDPKFVSAAAFNFRLMSNSPLINVAATIGSFSLDTVLQTRPQGSAWDIGPFEQAGITVEGLTNHIILRIR